MLWFSHLALSALAGVTLNGAYAPVAFFPLALLAPAAALWLWRAQPTLWRAAFSGWLFGVAHFTGGVYWVYHSLHDFGEAPRILAVLMTAVLVTALAGYFALLAAAVSYAARRLSGMLLALLLFPSLWVLSEWLRGVLFTGFPWNLVGQAFIDSPFVGVLPVFGIFGASWVAVFFAACLLLLCSNKVSKRVTVGIAVLVILPGLWATHAEWTGIGGEEVEVALLQGNIEQDLKFDHLQFRNVVNTYRRLTLQAVGADLIVWPETAVTAYYDLLEEDLLLPLDAKVRAGGGRLLLGTFLRESGTVTNGTAYNAAVQVAQPPRIYRKRHLVPFGEYLPLRGLLDFFKSWVIIPMSDLTAGNAQPLMRIADHDVGVSICYEVAFADEVMDALPQAAYLLNLSNDSWFGNSTAPHQHLQIARVRAAEAGRAMARATSTGISAIIDHRGVVRASSEQFEEQILTATIRPRRGRTPYAIWGNVPVLMWSCLIILGVALRLVCKRKNDATG